MRWIFEYSTLPDTLIFNLSTIIIPLIATRKPAVMQMLLWFFEVGNVRLHHYSWLWSLLTSCLRPGCPSETPNGSVPPDPSNLPKLFSGYQVEVLNLFRETVRSSVSNTTHKALKRTREPKWPPSVNENSQKKLPLPTSLNPFNLLKHEACRTTHGKREQEEQVPCISSPRHCVSENLWGYGYFQTVHRPQEVSSHATIQERSPESFQAAPFQPPWVSVHFLDGPKGTASGRPLALAVWRCWCQKGLVLPQWPVAYIWAGPHQSANLHFLPSWGVEGNQPDSDNRHQQAGPVQPTNSSLSSGISKVVLIAGIRIREAQYYFLEIICYNRKVFFVFYLEVVNWKSSKEFRAEQ